MPSQALNSQTTAHIISPNTRDADLGCQQKTLWHIESWQRGENTKYSLLKMLHFSKTLC